MDRTFNAGGQTLEVRRRWAINGQLHGDDSAAVITAKRNLEIAYARQFKDLVLWLDDDVTIHDALRNTGSTTGVRVISGPNWPTGKGAEGGTYLTYSIIVEAAYEWYQPANPQGAGSSGDAHESSDPARLESWTETITTSGGGPRYGMVEVVDGPPVRQKLNGTTVTRIVQSGSAKARRSKPIAPGPIEPAWENEAERSVSETSPTGVGQQSTGYQTSWTYVMEGPGIGGGAEPNPWPL